MSKKKNSYSITSKGPVFKAFTITFFTLLLIYAFSVLFLIFFGINTSLKSPVDFRVKGNVIGLPNLEISKDYALKLKNYANIIKDFNQEYAGPAYYSRGKLVDSQPVKITFSKLLWNSAIHVLGGAFCLTLPKMVMGYMGAQYKNPVSKFTYGMVLVMMMIPVVGTTPAMLTFLRNVGLYNNWLGNFICKFVFSGIYYLIFLEFFNSIPSAYREAAEVDGASQFRVMVFIYFPLAAKMFATIFLIQAIELWNDYNTILLYMPSYPSLVYGVYLTVVGLGSVDMGKFPVPKRISATMLLAVPTMIVFFIFKDRIMGNLSMGGLKE